MEKIPIVLITKDRSPKQNYIFQTIDSLKNGGVFDSEHFHSLTILDDFSNDTYIKRIRNHIEKLPITLITHSEVAGSKGNAERAHRLLASLTDETNWGMVMEDDITVCSRFLESAIGWVNDCQAEVRRIYFMALPSIPHGSKKDCYETSSFYGSQCYIVRTSDSLSIAEFLNTAGPFNNGHDTKLLKWLRATYEKKYHKVCSPVPTLIQHVGVESSIQKDRKKAHPHFYFIGTQNKYHRKK